ncbi:hypothetical protein [Mesoplasma seiffertii]|nr:hypothetical protein [Mesoplasma seiffertii]
MTKETNDWAKTVKERNNTSNTLEDSLNSNGNLSIDKLFDNE